KGLVGVAVKPALAGLGGSDHRVPALARMLAGVLIGRVVATQGDSTLLAGPQVHPGGARLEALGAFAPVRPLDGADRFQVLTDLARHGFRPVPALLAQSLVYEAHCNGALADRRGHALDAPRPDIPGRKHTRQARFQQPRW